MEVRGNRETARQGEDLEGGERGGEKSVYSNEVVVGECGWVWNGMENRECVGQWVETGGFGEGGRYENGSEGVKNSVQER